MGGLDNRIAFCASAGGQKSEIKVRSGLLFQRLLLDLQMAIFSVSYHFPAVHVCVCVQISPFIRIATISGEVTLMTAYMHVYMLSCYGRVQLFEIL